LGHVCGKELQRHETIMPGVLGLVDHIHPAAAQPLDDPVVRDVWSITKETPSFPVASSYGRGTGQSYETQV
jgi:hypothetical protein